ncbi:MAG: hypothetical protein N2381_09675, partial [Armatimonadetes bacterium]|nr:hypothetical protein [Armatimonadota bacterium]
DVYKRQVYDAALRRMLVHVEVIQGQRLYLIGIAFLLALTAGLFKLKELRHLPVDSRIAILFSCAGLWAMLFFNDTGALAIIPGLITAISYTFISVAATATGPHSRSSTQTAAVFKGG